MDPLGVDRDFMSQMLRILMVMLVCFSRPCTEVVCTTFILEWILGKSNLEIQLTCNNRSTV